MRLHRFVPRMALLGLLVSQQITNAQLFFKKEKVDARTRADGEISKADALVQEQKLSEAMKLYDGALRLDPAYPKAYLQRGLANVKARRLKEALADCGKAI